MEDVAANVFVAEAFIESLRVQVEVADALVTTLAVLEMDVLFGEAIEADLIKRS